MDDPFDDLKEIIVKSLEPGWEENRSKSSGCGIIYCRTRASTVDLANELSNRGISAKAYHAGLKDKEREKVQDDWMNGIVPVITATVSFGMGVDKASVRFVIHWGVPQSMAAYYQESGRAGRDGKRARCRLYYSRKERDAILYLLNKDARKRKKYKKQKGNDQAKSSIKNFEEIIKFSEQPICRHNGFAKYFGDEKPKCDDKCDFCVNSKAVEENVQKFNMSLMRKKDFRFGLVNVHDAGYDDELYGGGRRGLKRENEEYEADGYDSVRDNHEENKKQRISQLKQELSRRKKKNSAAASCKAASKEDLKKKEEEEAKHSKLKAAEFTSAKIAGLNIATRDSYCQLVFQSLSKNYQACSQLEKYKGISVLNDSDIEQVSINMEYEKFTSTSVKMMYQKGMMSLVMTLRKETADGCLNEQLASHTPDLSLSKLIRKIESEIIERKHSSFVTASQLLGSQQKLSFDQSQEHKHTEQISATEQKELALKHDANKETNQKSIDSYFAKTNSLPVDEKKYHEISSDSESEPRGHESSSKPSSNERDGEKKISDCSVPSDIDEKEDLFYDPNENQQFDMEETTLSDLEQENSDENIGLEDASEHEVDDNCIKNEKNNVTSDEVEKENCSSTKFILALNVLNEDRDGLAKVIDCNTSSEFNDIKEISTPPILSNHNFLKNETPDCSSDIYQFHFSRGVEISKYGLAKPLGKQKILNCSSESIHNITSSKVTPHTENEAKYLKPKSLKIVDLFSEVSSANKDNGVDKKYNTKKTTKAINGQKQANLESIKVRGNGKLGLTNGKVEKLFGHTINKPLHESSSNIAKATGKSDIGLQPKKISSRLKDLFGDDDVTSEQAAKKFKSCTVTTKRTINPKFKDPRINKGSILNMNKLPTNGTLEKPFQDKSENNLSKSNAVNNNSPLKPLKASLSLQKTGSVFENNCLNKISSKLGNGLKRTGSAKDSSNSERQDIPSQPLCKKRISNFSKLSNDVDDSSTSKNLEINKNDSSPLKCANENSYSRLKIEKQSKKHCKKVFSDELEVQSDKKSASKIGKSPSKEPIIKKEINFSTNEEESKVDERSERKSREKISNSVSDGNENCASSNQKKKVSEWVIKHLMPYYSKKRILSKDLFKSLAKVITHKVCQGNIVLDESGAKYYVSVFFSKVALVATEDDIPKL